MTSASATNANVFNSPFSDAIQPEDLVALFDEAEDAIDIDEEDSNRPDLEGNDADDPQKKKQKNKAKEKNLPKASNKHTFELSKREYKQRSLEILKGTPGCWNGWLTIISRSIESTDQQLH